MPLNYSKDIAKIVSHPGRQVPNRFHFLRLAELRFQFEPLRNVVFANQREWLISESGQLGREQR